MLVVGKTGHNCYQSVIYDAAQRPQQDTNEKERESQWDRESRIQVVNIEHIIVKFR
jgi:hypothetical protein